MRRKPVESTTMRSVGFKEATLEIEFVSGDVYRYYYVPREVHEQLMRADSHGRYFNERIRDRFPFARL